MSNQETKRALSLRGFTKPINEAIYDYLGSRGATQFALQERMAVVGGYKNINRFMLEAEDNYVEPVDSTTAPPENIIDDPGFEEPMVEENPPMEEVPPEPQPIEPSPDVWHIVAPIGTTATAVGDGLALTGDGSGYPTVSRTPPLTIGQEYKLTATVLLGLGGRLSLINGTEEKMFAPTLLGRVSLTFTAQTQSFTIKHTGLGLVTLGGLTVEPV